MPLCNQCDGMGIVSIDIATERLQPIKLVMHRDGDGRLPAHYGIAYFEADRDILLAYPIPINLVVALWHRVLCWLKVGCYVKLQRRAATDETQRV